ncbi:MAG: hypothetical protein HZB38_13130 [Planctomycetes bacterium]|nr:hypothetical protein [Planctomycetota bacterium]
MPSCLLSWPRALALGILFGTLSFLLAGCSGGGSFEFASLDMTKIDPPPPRVQRVPVDRAYWWVDAEDGSLRVAMQRNAPSLLGEIGRVLVRMSLRLEKPPAGASRQYAIRSGEFRGRIRVGASEARMTSAFGTAVIDRVDGNRIHGAVRLTANRQILQLLGGWGAASRTLVLGEFDAVPAKAEGRSIYADTESNDFTRPPLRPPTSKPASSITSRLAN